MVAATARKALPVLAVLVISALAVMWRPGLLGAQQSTAIDGDQPIGQAGVPTDDVSDIEAASPGSEDAPGIEEGPTVTFSEGRLTLRAQEVSLAGLLEAISRAAELAIILGDGLADRTISSEIEELAVDEVLRQLLSEEDAIYSYAAGTLKAVWVYPQGVGRGLEPVPPEAWASTWDFELGLDDPDPATRIQAVEVLVERKGEEALSHVLDALGDEDDAVRAETLNTALDEGLEVPADLLSELARNDPSDSVRFLALEALADDPMAVAVAEQALGDPSPHVRNQANEILDRLDGDRELPAPGQEGQWQ